MSIDVYMIIWLYECVCCMCGMMWDCKCIVMYVWYRVWVHDGMISEWYTCVIWVSMLWSQMELYIVCMCEF